MLDARLDVQPDEDDGEWVQDLTNGMCSIDWYRVLYVIIKA